MGDKPDPVPVVAAVTPSCRQRCRCGRLTHCAGPALLANVDLALLNLKVAENRAFADVVALLARQLSKVSFLQPD